MTDWPMPPVPLMPALASLAVAVLTVAPPAHTRAPAAQTRAPLADHAIRLTRDSVWTLVRSVPMSFPTFHPQGLVKIGDTLFVSSVEVRVPTRRGAQPDPRHDRDAGEGVGHLFKADLSGRLLASQTLSEGAIYHPGGIDYDGTNIWVPVAEYRPDSRAARVFPAGRRCVHAVRVRGGRPVRGMRRRR